MTFDPPPPPPPPGHDPQQPGSVPGYPGPGGQQYPGAPQHPGAPQYPGAPQHPGAPQFGGAPQYSTPIDYPNGTLILVLGIVGLVVCGPVGIAAWVMGNKGIKEIDSSGRAYANRGVVQAGKILGIIATVFLILGLISFVFLAATGGLAMFAQLGDM